MAWKIASIYIAAVVGAGFASGQELVQFFWRFGRGGVYGVVVATILLAFAGAMITCYCERNNTRSYLNVLKAISGNAAPYLDLLFTLFLLAGMAVMIAGSSAAWAFLFHNGLGKYITSLLVLVMLIQGPEKVLNLSAYIATPLLVLMLAVAIQVIATGQLVMPQETITTGFLYGLLYAGYNLGFALAIFSGLGRVLPSNDQGWWGGILGGITLGALIVLILLAFWSCRPEISSHPIPMLLLAEQWSPLVARGYGLTLWLAMYTTAVANGLSLVTRLQDLRGSWAMKSLGVIVIAFGLSFVGFVHLIKIAYPLFGYVGLYLMIQLFLWYRDT